MANLVESRGSSKLDDKLRLGFQIVELVFGLLSFLFLIHTCCGAKSICNA